MSFFEQQQPPGRNSTQKKFKNLNLRLLCCVLLLILAFRMFTNSPENIEMYPILRYSLAALCFISAATLGVHTIRGQIRFWRESMNPPGKSAEEENQE